MPSVFVFSHFSRLRETNRQEADLHGEAAEGEVQGCTE
jgi:hypothetical protein